MNVTISSILSAKLVARRWIHSSRHGDLDEASDLSAMNKDAFMKLLSGWSGSFHMITDLQCLITGERN